MQSYKSQTTTSNINGMPQAQSLPENLQSLTEPLAHYLKLPTDKNLTQLINSYKRLLQFPQQLLSREERKVARIAVESAWQSWEKWVVNGSHLHQINKLRLLANIAALNFIRKFYPDNQKIRATLLKTIAKIFIILNSLAKFKPFILDEKSQILLQNCVIYYAGVMRQNPMTQLETNFHLELASALKHLGASPKHQVLWGLATIFHGYATTPQEYQQAHEYYMRCIQAIADIEHEDDSLAIVTEMTELERKLGIEDSQAEAPDHHFCKLLGLI